ncbi:MAG TPA: universal stress protein [Jatrophihabitans sp.]|nr:universal stress protein [Jatrophihabitans sp.]
MSEAGIVVVGIDGSEVADAALVFAAHEASRRDAQLVVVHTGDLPTPAEHAAEVQPFAVILGQEAVATVAAIHPHLLCRYVLRDGDPADVLVELSGHADLLVVGTHRMGRLRGFVLGSVSQRVAAHATCPVVTVSDRVEADDMRPIVLGASATRGGMAALRFACEEARLRGVPVHAIRSITTEDWALDGPGYAMVLGTDVLRDAARAELDAVLRVAHETYPDVEIVGEVSNLNPFTALLKAASGAGLVVIGARRSQDSALPHLGPVAAWLLHQATCPLAVVGYTARDTARAATAEMAKTMRRAEA